MKIQKLYEDTIGDIANKLENGEDAKDSSEFQKEKRKFANALGINKKEIMDLDDPTDDIAKELTRSLIKAQKSLAVHPDKVPVGCNVLFEGNAGTAKTSRIVNWAKAHDVNLVIKRAVDLDETDLGGMKGREHDENGTPLNRTTRLSNHEFDGLYEPNSVLFLDEVNRARPEVVGSLLMLIQDHTITDLSEKDSMRKIPFLFTVAAINPTRGNYSTNELDPAMQSRFRKKFVRSNKANALSYLTKTFTKEIEDYTKAGDRESAFEYMGRLNLAKTLLSNDEFTFDNDAEEDNALDNGYNPLNNRTLSMALEACDGTKEDFLDVWDDICNPFKKEKIEDILEGYLDIEDDANNALRYGDAPTASQREEDDFAKLGLDD